MQEAENESMDENLFEKSVLLIKTNRTVQIVSVLTASGSSVPIPTLPVSYFTIKCVVVVTHLANLKSLFVWK